MMFAKVRLYLSACATALVLEGDPRGATLYAAPGDEIPDSAVEKFGLVDGTVSDDGAKERQPGQDKEKKGGEDKGGGKPPADPNALTSVKGIGAPTAAKLVAAGIPDVKALAALDPANVPQIDGLPPRFDWAATIALAQAGVPKVAAPAETPADAATETQA